MSKILMPVVLGSRVRNFLRTDLFTDLRGKADVVIVSPAYDDPAFLGEFRHPRVFFEPYDAKGPRRGIEFFLQTLETWFPNPGYASTDTYRIIVNSLSHTSALGKLRRLELPFLRKRLGVPYVHIMRELVRDLDFLISPPGAYQEPFDRHSPDLVFTDYPFHYCYRPILKIAHKRRIPIVCFVTSWDNLSCKGELPLRMDKMIVWNEIMKREAMDIYGYDPEDVLVSGAPQFDVYFRRDLMMSRNEFLEKAGLDPKKRLITYCTGGQALTTYESVELETIRMLLRWTRENKFGDQLQLLIRLHPGASPERFLELRSKDVFIDLPGRSEVWVDNWDPEGADMVRLANIMNSSDVVVNIASTITIDACCVDRPVVNVAFDADSPRPYWDSVARFYDFTHYKNVVRTGGVRLARSENELRECINAYLKDPQLDREGRERIVREQCYYADGKSGLRAAHHVLDFLNSVSG